MNGDKYIGLDVHQATISVAVLDSAGKLLMESVIETKAATILQFIQGLRGNLYVTFEEGTCAAWLYDLLKPHGSWRPPSGRATLPTTRSAAGSAPGSPPGTVGREPETSRDSRAAKDSIPRPGSSRLADRFAPDAPSFPHQAATLGLQRSGLGDAHQCGLSLRGRPTAALEETFRDQGSE